MPWSWPDLPHRPWRGGGPPWPPWPAAEVAGLLLVEVLGSPRARAAALGLARSLACWLAGRRPPASAGVEVTTRQVTVVKHADTSVLVHRVETAFGRAHPGSGPQTMSNARAARGNSGKRAPQLDGPVLPTATRQATAGKALLSNGSAWPQAATLPHLPSPSSIVQATPGAHAPRTWTAWSARVAGALARLQMHHRAGQGARDPVDGLDP
jgi:hypothetical protein